MAIPLLAPVLLGLAALAFAQYYDTLQASSEAPDSPWSTLLTAPLHTLLGAIGWGVKKAAAFVIGNALHPFYLTLHILEKSVSAVVSAQNELFNGALAAFEYVRSTAIPAGVRRVLIHDVPGVAVAASLFAFVESAAKKLGLIHEGKVTTIAKGEAAAVERVAEAYARGQAVAARNSAHTYTDTRIADLRTTLHTEIQAAASEAATASSSSAAATATANAAKATATAAASEAASGGLTAAQTQELVGLQAQAAALAAALTAAGGEAIPLPGGALGDLLGELNGKNLGTLAGLLGAIPLLRAITSSIATDAGLTSQECRSKVGNVCGTNPGQWGALLAGLVSVGLAFDLKALVDAAEHFADDVVPLVKQAV